MKLRIAANSIRLRLLRTEVDTLRTAGRIDETIYFNSTNHERLTYALAIERGQSEVQLHYEPSAIEVVLPEALAISWSGSDQVGIYATIDLGEHGILDLVVEKDFACLDRTDADNLGTFPNPAAGASC